MNSTQDGIASRKGGVSPGGGAAIRVEDGDGAERAAESKRKADTDCANREFELTLQERAVAGTKDFRLENRR